MTHVIDESALVVQLVAHRTRLMCLILEARTFSMIRVHRSDQCAGNSSAPVLHPALGNVAAMTHTHVSDPFMCTCASAASAAALVSRGDIMMFWRSQHVQQSAREITILSATCHSETRAALRFYFESRGNPDISGRERGLCHGQ